MGPAKRLLLIIAMVACTPLPGQSIVDRDGKKVFLRGMGWSPWHASYGWSRPQESIDEDTRLLRELQINAIRTWSPTIGSNRVWYATNGLYLIPQIAMVRAPVSLYGDGTKSRMTVFTDPGALAAIALSGRAAAEAHRQDPRVIALNLGNEYSTVGRNGKKQYVYGGFDAQTKSAFRSYLTGRFGEIGQLNHAFATSFTNFNRIEPPEGAAKNALTYEWFLFLRASFSSFMKAAYVGVREADPALPMTYARLLSRWDAACEDADLGFLELQGENLYESWGKDWGDYCVRLSRLVGPCRSALITETGIDTHRNSPENSARKYRQMLWLCVMHPEIVGICPFAFCDEWYKHGDPKKQDPDAEEHWGLLTATREKKPSFDAVKEVYGIFERINGFLVARSAPPTVLVTDQSVDDRLGDASLYVPLAREWYQRGTSFRMISLLEPEPWLAHCRRLVLIDRLLPSNPDGSSAAAEALLTYAKGGGEVLYVAEKPWNAVYPLSNIPAALSHPRDEESISIGKGSFTFVRRPLNTLESAARVGRFTESDKPALELAGDGVYYRVLTAAGRTMAVLVNTGVAPIPFLRMRTKMRLSLFAGDGAILTQKGSGWEMTNLDTYALLNLD